MAFTLTSPSFKDGERIPDKHARDGANLSPPLDWRDPPIGTRSYVLVVEDPDAPHGTFRHWVAYDIPPGRHHLEEGAGRRGGDLKDGANDFGNPSYDGPQPPQGHGRHRYYFRLAAIDLDHLDTGPPQRAEEIWAMAQPHMLAEAALMGTYER